MAKLPKKVPIIYVGKKQSEEDTVAGTGLRWTPGQAHFVTPEQAGKLLHYPTVWADGRTEDDKRRFGPISTIAPVDHRYADQSEEEKAEGRDVMPLVDIHKLDERGLVTFAGVYLNRRLNVTDGKAKLLAQVNLALEGQRFEWA